MIAKPAEASGMAIVELRGLLRSARVRDLGDYQATHGRAIREPSGTVVEAPIHLQIGLYGLTWRAMFDAVEWSSQCEGQPLCDATPPEQWTACSEDMEHR